MNSPISPSGSCITHNLALCGGATAVCGGQGGRTCLRVPRDLAVLRHAADGQRVDAIGVAITVTVVIVTTTVTRRPHKYRAQTAPTLKID